MAVMSVNVKADSANIPLAMLIVFGSAKLSAEVCERLGQPGIVGEILAGVVIGPGVLGLVRPGQVLSALAQLGVMFLLFRVGSELKSKELMEVGGTAISVAVVGVLVPFFLGWAIMGLFHEPKIESIFVGAAMVATSVGITAQVLAAKGLLQHRASKVILAAAVIDDVLGLIVLAVVSGLARGRVNVTELVLTAVAAVAFVLVVAKWGTTTMERVIHRVQPRLRAGEVQFNLAMIVLFGLAVLAIYAGVAAIIGAFLAGMVLADSLEPRVRQLTHGVSELLVPFFLVGIGLHVKPSVFEDRTTVVLAVVILVAAIVAKLVGCGIGAMRMGWADAVRVGLGMAPRGEVGMVVAQIGLGLGVVSGSIYAVVVFMAVLTTVFAPPAMNVAFRSAREERPVEECSMR